MGNINKTRDAIAGFTWWIAGDGIAGLVASSQRRQPQNRRLERLTLFFRCSGDATPDWEPSGQFAIWATAVLRL